jgi:hypothetical protein
MGFFVCIDLGRHGIASERAVFMCVHAMKCIIYIYSFCFHICMIMNTGIVTITNFFDTHLDIPLTRNCFSSLSCPTNLQDSEAA